MKKFFTYGLLFLLSLNVHSQDKVNRQLTTIGQAWGACYMLHPGVVSSTYPLNWEGVLVDYLKDYPFQTGEEHLLDSLNMKMLARLEDPLTALQSRDYQELPAEGTFLHKTYGDYDYIRLPASFLSTEKNWLRFDHTLVRRTGDKPLVLDLRFFKKPSLNPDGRDCFSFICGMLTSRTLSLGSLVSRTHYGWDEMNQTPYFEQQWKVTNSGLLPTLAAFPREAHQSYSSVNFSRIIPIDRPVYMLVNNATLQYYRSHLKALKESNNDISIIWEKRGRLFDQGKILKFSLQDADLFINPYVLLSESPGFRADYETSRPVLQEDLYGIIHTRIVQGSKPPFSFDMSPRLYPTAVKPIGREYKLLGLFKLRAVFEYLYDDPAGRKDGLLSHYIRVVLKTQTDREYYSALKEMIRKMDHRGTYLDDSWIFDFSGCYVAPVKMDWVDGQLVVTDAGAEARRKGISPGDPILKIRGRYVEDLMVEARHVFFGEKEDEIRKMAFDRNFFSGPKGSTMALTVQKDRGSREVLLTRNIRSRHHPDYTGVARDVNLPPGIGYISAARGDLAGQLEKHSNARALVIDLREGSVQEDYQPFVQMLADSIFKGHATLTPLLSAAKPEALFHNITPRIYRPDKDAPTASRQPAAVLVDGQVAGHEERLAYDLKQMGRVFLAGRPTRGRMSRLTSLYLPGDARLFFPGHYTLNKEGRKIQGPLNPDFEVVPGMPDIRAGRDVILEKALEELKNRL